MKRNTNRNTGRQNIYEIASIVLFMCTISLVLILVAGQYNRWRANRLFEELADSVVVETEAAEEEITEAVTEEATSIVEEVTEPQPGVYDIKIEKYYEQYGIEVPKLTIKFDILHRDITEDIYAWIYIPDTGVSYPVLQHPTDNSYYLEYNLNGTKGYPGCIYTENYNSKDFMDRHTAIYGHNMRDGSMFSDLHLYEDEEFFNNNKYVYIYTEEDVFVYEIFAAYQTDNVHQILGYNVSTEEGFNSYFNKIFSTEDSLGFINRDIAYSMDTKLLTLSTCVMEERQFHLRYLVQAVMLEVE